MIKNDPTNYIRRSDIRSDMAAKRSVRLLNKCSTWNETQISLIEEKYKGKYLLESCLRTKGGGWADFPAPIFYTPLAHPEGSNYFSVYRDPLTDEIMVANAMSAVEEPIIGLLIDDTVIYSKYCHDYVSFKGVVIDGGREYVRKGGERIEEAEEVLIRIIGPDIVIESKYGCRMKPTNPLTWQQMFSIKNLMKHLPKLSLTSKKKTPL